MANYDVSLVSFRPHEAGEFSNDELDLLAATSRILIHSAILKSSYSLAKILPA
jgi:hypothetical protein